MAGLQQKTIRGPVILEEIHSSGHSVANLDGRNYYLDFGIPGEEVTFVMHRKKLGFRSGEVVEVVKPSHFRVEPFCRHHLQCGGCPWQHISYDHQLTLKHNILSKALIHYGIQTPEIPSVIASPDLHYFRHRVEYTFAANAIPESGSEDRGNSGMALGFHRHGEPNQVIDIHECYLQQQPSRSICDFVKSYAIEQGLEFYDHELKTGFLRSMSIRTTRSGEVMVVIGINQDNPPERELFLRKLKL
jgi:23S rRNA (uracil1939-C5)-methyltransferase